MDIQEFDDEYDSDDSFLDRLETIEVSMVASIVYYARQ